MPGVDYGEVDPRTLVFVGAGKEGRVYRLEPGRCIKFYNKSKYRERELAALRRGQSDPLFPRLFAWGKGYTVREYIPGTSLDAHLAEQPLSPGLALKLLEMHQSLLRLGFRRADLRLAHLILMPAGRLRVIDPTNMMKEHRTFPRKMLADLARLGRREQFLAMAADLRPDIYQSWRRHLT